MLALNQEAAPSGKEVNMQASQAVWHFPHTQTGTHCSHQLSLLIPFLVCWEDQGAMKECKQRKRRHLPESHEEQRRGALHFLEALAARRCVQEPRLRAAPPEPLTWETSAVALGQLQAHASSIWAELHGYLTPTPQALPLRSPCGCRVYVAPACTTLA